MGHEQGADEHMPDDANEVDGMSTRVQVQSGETCGRVLCLHSPAS